MAVTAPATGEPKPRKDVWFNAVNADLTDVDARVTAAAAAAVAHENADPAHDASQIRLEPAVGGEVRVQAGLETERAARVGHETADPAHPASAISLAPTVLGRDRAQAALNDVATKVVALDLDTTPGRLWVPSLSDSLALTVSGGQIRPIVAALPHPLWIDRLSTEITTADAAANVRFAVWTMDGTLIVDAGTANAGSVGTLHSPVFGPIQLPAGYLALTAYPQGGSPGFRRVPAGGTRNVVSTFDSYVAGPFSSGHVSGAAPNPLVLSSYSSVAGPIIWARIAASA